MLSPAMTALLLAITAQNPVSPRPTFEPAASGTQVAPRNAYVAPARGAFGARNGGALTGSRFPEWYSAARAVVEKARAACRKPSDWGGWCGQYWNDDAAVFNVQPLIDSEGLAVASYLVAPGTIQGAFAELRKVASQRGAAVATELKPLESDLDRAAGLTAQNAGIGLGLPLPGLDLGAQAQKIMEGIAAAMKERAEQEAVLYVLEVFDQQVCKDAAVKPFLWNTCTLAASGAFSGTVAGGGAATIELLRNALEVDARALPGNVGRNIVRQGYDQGRIALPTRTRDANAEAVGNLVDDLVRGLRPERALETFSTALSAGLEAEPATTTQRAVQLLACGAGLPAALSRGGQLVDATRPELAPNGRGLALGLVALESARCAWLYEALWRTGFEGVPFDGGAGRLRLWARYATGLSALALDMNDAERFLGEARAAAEKALAAAKEKGDPEAVALAIADSVFAALDAADAVTRISSQLVALARTAKLTEQAKVEAARLQAGIEAAAVAIRRVRSYGDLVHAAATRDHGRTIQAALRASVVTDGAGAGIVTLPEKLQQSLGLIVAIVNAKTPEEVKGALLAAAAPAGSWRLKYGPAKESDWNGDWNGTVTFGGLVGFGSSVAKEVGWSSRLMIPVGVDVVPYAWRTMNISFFLQLLDVAGYANQGDRKPRVLQGVVPGASLKIPVWKSPFAAFAGATYALDDGQEKAGPAWRFNAGIAVDVSLFVLNRP